MSAPDPGSPHALLQSDADTQKNLKKTVDETKVNMRCVYVTVLASFLFIAALELVYVSYYISLETTALRNRLEQTQWSGVNPDSIFSKINSLIDVDRYVRNVLIPILTANATVLESNFLIAFRYNLKRAILKSNPVDEFRTDFPEIWEQTDYSYSQQNSGEETGPLLIWNYTVENSFRRAGAYTVTLFPQLVTNETRMSRALYRWRLMHRAWLSDRTISLVLEMLLQNSNLGATVYYFQAFEMTSEGRIRTHSDIYGVFIEPFEYISSYSSTVLFLCILLLLEVLARIYGAFLIVIRCVTVAIRERRNDMEYYESIGLLTLVLEIAGISLYLSIFAKNMGKLEIPVTDADKMSYILDETVEFRSFVQVCSICILLITLRAILILKNEFPSFGILFDTIVHAWTDLFHFTFMAFIMLFAFSLTGFMLFGLQATSFSTLAGTMLTLCTMSVGLTNYSEMQETHSTFAGLFFLVFQLVFKFIVMNMFLGIVMSTYMVLRRRNQMFIMAKASILTREAAKLKTRWLNFLLCRRPQGTTIELAKKYITIRENPEIDAAEREKQMIDLRNTMLQAQTISLKDTLKYNMSQLEVFQSFIPVQTSNLKTREQYIEELMLEIKAIKDELRRKHEEKLKQRRDKNYIYSTIKDMVIYSIFMIIFSVMVIYRSRIDDKFLLEEAMRTEMKLRYFHFNGVDVQFADVNTPEIAAEWLQQVFFRLGSGWQLHRELLGDLRVRETLIRIKPEKNKYDGTSAVFPYVREKEEYGQLPLSEYLTPSATDDFVGESGHVYVYKGGSESYRGYGGYVSYWTTDYNTALASLQRVRQDNLLGSNTKVLIYDVACYSGDTRLLAISSVGFLLTEAGGIKSQVQSVAFELDLYSHGNTTVPALEVIFVLFIVYYLYRFVVDWVACLKEQRARWAIESKEKMLLEDVLQEIHGIEHPQRTGSEECISIVRKAFDYLHASVTVFVRTSYSYLQKDFYNIFDVAILSLSLAMMITILKLQISDFRSNFDLAKDNKETLLPGLWELADLDVQYRSFSAVNCLLIYLRMLKNFRFSSQLSVLTDVLGSAALDIIFFAAVFTMLLASYSLMGYTLLGHRATDFSTLSSAFLSTYFLLLGQFDSDQIVAGDSPVGTIFLITFLLFFQLCLFNMFIAIVVAHFDQVSADTQLYGGQESLFLRLKETLQSYMQKLGAGRLKRLLHRCFGAPAQRESEPEASEEEAQADEKPAQPEKVEPESVNFSAFSTNSWLKALEDKLKENSKDLVNFVKLKGNIGAAELKNNLVTMQLDASAITFMTKELWLREHTISRKVYLWRQLSLAHQAQQMHNEGLKALGQEVQPLKKLSALQMDIWQNCDIALKLALWTDIFGFNSAEKADVWNVTLFSAKQMAGDEQDWTLEKQTKLLNEMIQKSLEVAAGKAVEKESLPEFLTRWKAEILSYNQNFATLSRDTLACIAVHYTENQDERLALWLSQNETEQMELMLNNSKKPEATLLFYLLAEGANHHIIRLEMLDATASTLMDARLYDKHVRLAQLQVEKARLREREDNKATAVSDSSALENYRHFLKKKVESKGKLLEDRYNERRTAEFR